MSNDIKYVDNVSITLTGSYSTTDTSLTFATGQGIRIPAVTSPEVMTATMLKLSTGELERVLVTAHTLDADSCTVVRGLGGDAQLAFNSGDVELRFRFGRDDLLQIPKLGLTEQALVAAGSVNALTASMPDSLLQGIPDNFQITLIGAITNTSDAPTLNLTIGTTAVGAKTIVKGNQDPLSAGDIVPVAKLLYRSSWDQWVLINPYFGEVLPGDLVESNRTETTRNGYLKPDGSAVNISTYVGLRNAVTRTATVTITIASPGVVSWTAHGLRGSDEITLETTGSLPTGLSTLTPYYVVPVDANSFQLSLTPGGVAINTSGSQAGVQTARHFPHGAGDGSTTFNLPDVIGRSRIAAGQASKSVSVDANSVANGSDSFTVPDNEDEWITGMKVQLTTTGTLPTGLSLATDYFIIRIDSTTIKFASDLENAAVGTVVNLTSDGTGVHTVTVQDLKDRKQGYKGGEEEHGQSRDEVGRHDHSQTGYTGSSGGSTGLLRFTNMSGSNVDANTDTLDNTQQTVQVAMNVIQPYIAENVWIKT